MSVCSFLSQQAASAATTNTSSANSEGGGVTQSPSQVASNSTLQVASNNPTSLHTATPATFILPGSTTQFQLNSNGNFGTNQAGYQTTTGTATLTTMNHHHHHLPFTTNSTVHNLYNEKPILTLVNSNKLKTVNYKDHNLISIKSTPQSTTTTTTPNGVLGASNQTPISLVQISPASSPSSSNSPASSAQFNHQAGTKSTIVRQLSNNLDQHKFMYKKASNNQTILVLSKQQQHHNHQHHQKLSKSNNLISSYFNKDLLNKSDLIQATTTTTNNSSLNPISLNLFDPVVGGGGGATTASTGGSVSSNSTSAKPITLIPIGNLTDKQVLNSLTGENINFLQPMINLPPTNMTTTSSTVNSISNNNNNTSNSSPTTTSVLEPSCLETIEISTACVEVEIDSSVCTVDQSVNSSETNNLDFNHNHVDKSVKKVKKATKINKNSDNNKASSKKCKEIISCICEMDHDDGYMISCDNCHAWQHLACMEINRKKIPEKFNCTKCEPRATNSLKAKQIQERYVHKYLRSTTINSSASPSSSKMSPSPSAGRRNSNQNDIEYSSSTASAHSLPFNLTSTQLHNELSDMYVQFRSRVRLVAKSNNKLKELEMDMDALNSDNNNNNNNGSISPECISKSIQSNCLKCVKVKNTSSGESDVEESPERSLFSHLKSFFLLKASQPIKMNKIVGEYKGRVQLVDELDAANSFKSPYFIVYKLSFKEISETITSTTSPSTPSSSNLPSSSSSTSSSATHNATTTTIEQSKLVFVDASTALFNMDPTSQQFKNGRQYVIRKSCKPNTSVKHVVDSQGSVHFLIETKSAVQKLDEITLPFDLSFLYDTSCGRFDSIALDKFVYENRNFFTCQCNNASCSLRTKLKSSYYKKLLKKEKEPQVSSSSDAKRKRAYSTDSNQSEVTKSRGGSKNKTKASKIKEESEEEEETTSNKNKQRGVLNTTTTSNKKAATSTPSSSLYEDEMNALLNNGKNLSREDRKLMSYMKVIEKLERQTNRKKELKEQREAAKLAAASSAKPDDNSGNTVKENDTATSNTTKANAKKQPRLSIKQEFVQNNPKVDQEHKLADMEIEHIIQKGGNKTENSGGASSANTTFHQHPIESPDYSFVNLAIQPRQTLDLLQRNLSSPAGLLVPCRVKTLEPLENDVDFILKHQRNNNSSLNSPNPLSPANMIASPVDASDYSRRDFFNPKKHWLKCSSISTESYSNLDPSTPMSAPPLKKRRHMVQFDEDSQQSDITVKSEWNKNETSPSNLIIDTSLSQNDKEPEQPQIEEELQQQQSESLLNEALLQSLIHQNLAAVKNNDELSTAMPTASSSSISCYEMADDSAYQVSSIGTSSSTSMTELDSGSVNPNGKKKVSLAEYRMRKESTTTPITPTLTSPLDIDLIDSPTSRFLAKPKPFLDSIFSSKRITSDSNIADSLHGLSQSTLLFLKQEPKEEVSQLLSKSMTDQSPEDTQTDNNNNDHIESSNHIEDVESSFELVQPQTLQVEPTTEIDESYEGRASRSRSVSGENSSDLSRSRSDSVGSDYSLISSCSSQMISSANQDTSAVADTDDNTTAAKVEIVEPKFSRSYSSITSVSEDEGVDERGVHRHQSRHDSVDDVKKSDMNDNKSDESPARRRPRSTSRDRSRKRRDASSRSHRSHSNELRRSSGRRESRDRNTASRIDYSRSSRHYNSHSTSHHHHHHSSRHHDYRHRGGEHTDRSVRRVYHDSTTSFNGGYNSRRKDYNLERKKQQLDEMLDEYKRNATITIQSKNLSSSSSRSNSSSISPRSIRVPVDSSGGGIVVAVVESTIHTTPESINESHERSKSPKNISSSDLRYHLNSMK